MSDRGTARRRVLVTLLMLLPIAPFIGSPTAVVAVGEPSITWATVDGGTVGGLVDLAAEASATSGTITKWCLSVDGTPVTTNVATYGGDPYRWVNSYGSFNGTTGCWSSNVVDLAGGAFVVDTTKWTNGNHVFSIAVTDSSFRTATSSISLTVTNQAPSFAWATPDADTYTGAFTIAATATPDATGTAEIRRWCLTIDGAPVASDIAVYGGSAYTWVNSYGVFNPATGCWSSNVVDLRGGAFLVDSTGWPNGEHRFVVTVTDSSGRATTSSTLTETTTNAGPKVAWTTPDSGTQSGVATIRATAAADPNGTAVITRWCLTFEGAAVDVDIRSDYARTIYTPLSYAAFDAVTGCWTDADGDITGGQFDFDTSGMPDDSYVFQLVVTDSSGRSATSTPLTVVTNNPAPSVSVSGIAAPPTSISRWLTFTVSGQPAATSTATIASWCFSIDGSSLTQDITDENYFSSNPIRDAGTFDPISGCYTPAYSGSDISSGRFTVDTTKWTDKVHTLVITLTDTAGKATARQIPMATSNPLPALGTSGIRSGLVTRRQLVISASATFVAQQSDITIAKWCLSIDNGTCRAATTSSYAALWSVNTAAMKNGGHIAVVSARDTIGRVVRTTTYTFSVNNTAPTAVSAAGTYSTPRISSTSASINLAMRTVGASQITIRWGTSRYSLTSSKTITAASAADFTTRSTITGLRFGTTYYFEVRAKNAVGQSATVWYSAVAPRRAYITGRTCSTYLNYNILYVWYTHIYTYRWSSGELTYSAEFAGRC